MRSRKRYVAVAVIAGLAAGATVLPGQQPPVNPAGPNAGPVHLARDATKADVERPAVAAVARWTAPAAGGAARPDFVNPRVAPGQVRWHATFADACEAAQTSGRPVLLFQMTGRLDEQFC